MNGPGDQNAQAGATGVTSPASRPRASAALVLGLVAVTAAALVVFSPNIEAFALAVGVTALVLGVVGLVQKPRRRFAVAGTVLGVVSILVAVTGSFAAIRSGPEIVTLPPVQEAPIVLSGDGPLPGEISDDDLEPLSTTEYSPGTAGNPLPLGEEFTAGRWTGSIDEVVYSAADRLETADGSMATPQPHMQFVLVKLTLVHDDSDDLEPIELRPLFLVDGSPAGRTNLAAERVKVAPGGGEQLDLLAPVPGGVPVSGYLVYSIPEGAEGMVYIESPFGRSEYTYLATTQD